MTYKKIDLHAHYLSPGYKKFLHDYFDDLGDGVKTPAYEIETTLDIMSQTNIDYSVISISSPHPNTSEKESTIALIQEVNSYGALQQATYPDKIGFFASLPIPYIQASLETIDTALDEQHAIGFTLPTNARGVYLGDARLDAIMAKLNARSAIVAIHPNEPWTRDKNVAGEIPTPIMEFFFDTTRTVMNMLQNEIFTRYPNIRFIIPHGGAVLSLLVERVGLAQALNPALTDAQVNLKDVMKNLYFDVAGFVLPQQLPALMDFIDVEKIVYASDTPYTPTSAVLNLAKVLEDTDLYSAEFKQKLFFENAQKLLQNSL
ncbi:amidohydrolase family protein [Listeria booriae]|uniref:amidohydrolase family protein n=1 Tax=Listeria booriae TaxID=1552123 RepID=UPI001623F47D|nr:amidohydrolase family protein [Listeria booriae]MBC2327757.1 amidohydrolase [Listeria booriae]